MRLGIIDLFKSRDKSNADNTDTGIIEQSPLWIRTVASTIILTSSLAIGWLAIARTEEIVVVQGKLEPQGLVKEVYPVLQGVVQEVFVKEGSIVKKGDSLIRLDTRISEKTLLTTTKNLESKRDQLRLKQGEIEKTRELALDRDLSLKETLILQENILSRLERLNRAGAIPELQYLSQKDKVQTAVSQLSQNRLELQRQEEVLRQQIKTLEAEIQDLELQLRQAGTTLSYQEIRSPADGIVFDLGQKYQGSTVEPNKVIMKIVPPDQLVGTIEVPSNKIGFVRKGMPVDVSIDSFPATDFGVVHGHIKQVGSDALPPSQVENRKEYMFPATIALKTQFLRLKNGTTARLASGMSIHANIKLRSVSYLSLVLQSLSDKADSVRTR